MREPHARVTKQITESQADFADASGMSISHAYAVYLKWIVRRLLTEQKPFVDSEKVYKCRRPRVGRLCPCSDLL